MRAAGASIEEVYEAGYSKGERFASLADEWVEANPAAWDFMTSRAVERAAGGRRFGIGELCEQVRWHMAAEGLGEFKVNNNHRAALARRLVREHPECRPFIRTRDSVVDLLKEEEHG